MFKNFLNFRYTKEIIYLDKASTKPIEEKWNKLLFNENRSNFQNLSSISPQSLKNKHIIEGIRHSFRYWLDANDYFILFTSGATESLNLAFKGIVFKQILKNKLIANKERNIVISLIEHKAVLEICKFLKLFGIKTRFIPILKTGIIDKDKLSNCIDKETILLSLPYINNETGNCQPFETIGKLKKKYNFAFHCDLTASLDFGPFSLKDYGIDIASFSAHKMCGIKGLGGIAISDINKICPLIHGGGQQDDLRGGTENFPAIKVWGEHLKEKIISYKEDQKKINILDSYCINAFKREFKNRVIFNSFLKGKRLPGIVNLSIKGIPNNELIAFLSERKVFIGNGSACNNIHFEESKALYAMGFSREEQKNILRISFDENNRVRDFDILIENIKLFEHNLKTDKSLKIEKNEDLNDVVPDCESYRKIALKYWFNQIGKNRDRK